jgi:hypothetical protein
LAVILAPRVSTPATREIGGQTAVPLRGAALRVEVIPPDAAVAAEAGIREEMVRVATGATSP